MEVSAFRPERRRHITTVTTTGRTSHLSVIRTMSSRRVTTSPTDTASLPSGGPGHSWSIARAGMVTVRAATVPTATRRGVRPSSGSARTRSAALLGDTCSRRPHGRRGAATGLSLRAWRAIDGARPGAGWFLHVRSPSRRDAIGPPRPLQVPTHREPAYPSHGCQPPGVTADTSGLIRRAAPAAFAVMRGGKSWASGAGEPVRERRIHPRWG